MNRTTFRFGMALAALAAVLGGCKSTYDAKRISAGNVAREDTIVFVRPERNLPLQSLRRRLEITHEQAAPNAGGLLALSVGMRNKSGTDLRLSVRTAFYEQPFGAPGYQTSAPIYETAWQQVSIPRGATKEYKVICPKPAGGYYQVTVSEILK